MVQFTATVRKFDMYKITEKLETKYYSEIIAFSLDCNDVQPADIKLQRQLDGTFPDLDTAYSLILENIESAGNLPS